MSAEQLLTRLATLLGLRAPAAPPAPLHPLDTTTVRELMVPRVLLPYVDRGDDLSNVRSAMRKEPTGRLTVLIGEETVAGIVAVADLPADEEQDWTDAIRPVPYLFEGASARTAAKTLRNERSREAAVLDEHGGLVGWLTDNDLREVSPDAMALGDGSVIEGTFGARLLGEALDIDVDEYHSASVGGLVTELLGHFGQPGESVEIGGWVLTVREATQRRVLSVELSAPPAPPAVEPTVS